MAIYLVLSDDYAGWNSTGRNFSLIGAAIGAIGLLSWMSLHHHLGAFRPDAITDQLFLEWLVWVGTGGFCLMAIAAFGSIGLSLRSRGSVSITAEGVSRTVATRTRSLAWAEIEGLVAMPYGGVTLVAVPGKMDIVIPRFLDDYRACIAEIKNHNIQTLAPSSLRRKLKTSWMDTTRIVLASFAVSLALDSHRSHSVRIASFVVLLASIALFVRSDAQNRHQTVSRWISFTLFVGIALFIGRRMSLNW